MNEFLLYCLSIIENEVEQSKFEALYYEYRHAMFYTANGILRDHGLAEDAVQEAFLRIMKHLEKIDENDCHKTKAFMVIIAKNIAINMYNKRKRDNEVFFFEETVEGDSSYESSKEDRDVQQIVQCIKKLPELYIHIMMLRYLYEYSDKECAELLKLSEAAARKRLERGRGLLKEQLEKEAADDAKL